MARKPATKPPGTRGPVKGKGGRPPASRKTAAAKVVDEQEAEGFVCDLAELSKTDFVLWVSQWKKPTTADSLLMGVFWDAVQRYVRFRNELANAKSVQEHATGSRQQCPEVGMLNKAIADILTLASKFAMSPADRARLGQPPEKPENEDPFADHLSRIMSLQNGPTEAAESVRRRKVPGRSPKRKTASRKK